MTTDYVNLDDTDAFDDLPTERRLGFSMRAWRTCEERTLEDVAKQLGISKQVLSLYERGEKLPSLKKTLEIATVLGAPPSVWLEYRLNDEIQQISDSFRVTLHIQVAS